MPVFPIFELQRRLIETLIRVSTVKTQSELVTARVVQEIFDLHVDNSASPPCHLRFIILERWPNRRQHKHWVEVVDPANIVLDVPLSWMIARCACMMAATNIEYHANGELHASNASKSFASAQNAASVLHSKAVVEPVQDGYPICAKMGALVEITRCRNRHKSMRPSRRQA
jgi:hypothetical protein